MRRSYNISIPEPCHENWQAMTPTEKGRFCASCQKNVIDFTTASDSQIAKALQQNEHLCGRFLSTQLNRDLVVRKEKKSFWIAASTTVLSFLSIGNSEVKAQEKPRTEQTDSKVISSENHLESDNQEMTISGNVSEGGLPLPGTSVDVKGSDRNTQADIDGNFTIMAKKGEILVFSFIGMKDQEIEVRHNGSLKIDMVVDENSIVNTYLGGVCGHQRTFFGRIFHRIGNWFR